MILPLVRRSCFLRATRQTPSPGQHLTEGFIRREALFLLTASFTKCRFIIFLAAKSSRGRQAGGGTTLRKSLVMMMVSKNLPPSKGGERQKIIIPQSI